MKSFKQLAEESAPKFERATKTDVHYTGTINGRTWVVPHSFHGSGDVLHGAKVTPMRHNIVVSPIHVAHNNPSLTPQEHARIHSHIKDIHGGQEGKVPKFDSMGKLDEDLKADWNRDFSKNRRSNIKRTMRQNLSVKNVGKGNNAWRKADKEDRHPGVVSWPAMNEEEKAPEQKKDNDAATRRELKAARPMRKGAAERFMQRYGKTKIAEEERQQSLHLGMTMADRVQPSKEVPEVKKAETHYKQTHKPVKGTPEYQAERDKYRHPALAASRRAATLAFAKKHHLLEIKNMLNESKPKNGGRVNVFDYHQTQIAKKTLRMPDAMVGVMGGMNKDESRKHLKKMGWTDSQIHKHEHDQFVSEHVWTVTDHLGNKHEVEAKDRTEAMRKTVSVGSKIHPEGIPLTQWNKVKVERKNLEERTLTTGEDAKKEEIVHSMKKKLQGFKERYGKDAKSVMYATATKQAKRLAEEVLKSSHGTVDGHSHVVRSSFSNGKFHGTVHTSHRDNRYSYTGPEPVSPVEHEKPKKWSHDVLHGTTGSAIRKKNPHLDSTQAQAISRHFEEHKNKVRQLSEGVEQLEEATTQAKRLAEEIHAYDVHHRGKHIDTIFYGHNEPVEEVKKSLINHDGYHPNITVIKQARKLKEEAEQMSEMELKSSHGTADGHSHVVKSSYANGKFSGTVHTSHRDNRYTYTGPEARSPVEHEKPKKFSHDVRQGTTASVIRKKNPHLDQTQALAVSRHFDEHKNKVRQLSEGVEPLEEMELKGINVTSHSHASGKTKVYDPDHIRRDKQKRTSSVQSIKNFMKAIQRVKGKKAPETVKVKKGQQLLPLEESFMGTYTRNENANRHTANIVHLAKHFGTEADKSEAKFYSDELKKHGHNKHHEAAYKLHEKLWPRAVAAHHMSEEQALVEEKKYTGHFPAQHKVWLAKRDETARGFRRNQDAKRRLAKKQAENPVKEEHSDTYNTIKRVLRGD
jgi:hypothetical protein